MKLTESRKSYLAIYLYFAAQPVQMKWIGQYCIQLSFPTKMFQVKRPWWSLPTLGAVMEGYLVIFQLSIIERCINKI